jgi:hypothetical protein
MDVDHTISHTGGIRGIGFPSRDPSSRERHARSPSRLSSPLRLGRVLAKLTPWEPEVHGLVAVDELGWGAVVLRSLVSKLPLERGRLDDSLTLFQFGQITFMPLHRAAHHGLDGLAADRVFQVLLSPADHLAQRVVQALLDLRGEPAVGGELAQWLQPAACGHQQRPELGGVAGDTRSQVPAQRLLPRPGPGLEGGGHPLEAGGLADFPLPAGAPVDRLGDGAADLRAGGRLALLADLAQVIALGLQLKVLVAGPAAGTQATSSMKNAKPEPEGRERRAKTTAIPAPMAAASGLPVNRTAATCRLVWASMWAVRDCTSRCSEAFSSMRPVHPPG